MHLTNEFVDFLNSLHNENASNKNAIAEDAISSDFFQRIEVRRDLLDSIRKKIEQGDFVILTGHAGDGKTTLLWQLLDDLGYREKQLPPTGDWVLPDGLSFHYVKDMSELKESDQQQELKTCFERDGASLLIGNTGPLLATFKKLFGDGIEETLLNAMDSQTGESLRPALQHREAFLVNIARIDNTDFIAPFLKNILEPELWEACENCSVKDHCPMYINQLLLSEQLQRASSLISNIYLWLQEYDKRTTIRQMTAHISYAMTGGLRCMDVQTKGGIDWPYAFLFSNLFFGLRGNEPIPDAMQIRGVVLVNEAGFDRRQTSMDYVLHTVHKFADYYPQPLNTLLNSAFQGPSPRSRSRDLRVLKRAYMFFGQNDQQKDAEVTAQFFSKWFTEYVRLRSDGGKVDSKLKKTVITALNTLFVGDSGSRDTNEINLTLRRNNEQVCNVQVLKGRIPKDEIEISCKPVSTVSSVSSRNLYTLTLRYRNLRFPLSLPLINYFDEIFNGVIVTDIDPLLSNGIDNLKSQLLSKCQSTCEDNEVQLVYLKGSYWAKRLLTLENHKICHE